MSNIFCTFAADLGIVPAITQKKGKEMNKKVLCRFMIGGKVLKLVERTELGGRWSDYQIMEGRRRAEHGRIYNSYSTAWEAFESICRSFFEYQMEGGKL